MKKIETYLPLLKKWQTWLIILLLSSSLFRFWNLGFIKEYVFDEVYHAFTAKMYSLQRYEAWVWWESPPEGVAYEWTHPPLAKVIMSWGIDMFGGPGEMPDKARDPKTLLTPSSFGWRFYSAVFGVLGTLAIFLFTSKVFNNKWIGIIASFLFTFDILPLVQSRTAMNDIFAVTFLLFSYYFFLQRTSKGLPYTPASPLLSYKLPIRYWLLGSIFLGCAVASKWTSFFGIGIFVLYHAITVIYHLIQLYFHYHNSLHEVADSVLRRNKILNISKKIGGLLLKVIPLQIVYGLLFVGLVPLIIYLLSYWQLFTLKIYDYKGNSLAEEIQRTSDSTTYDNQQLESIRQGKCMKDEYTNCDANLVEEGIAKREREIGIWRVFNSKNPYLADRFFIWWGVQKQMWWYHTNLKASHNYTSQWWTWPLDLRPVWFYVKYCGSTDTNLDTDCKASLRYYKTERTIGDVYTMGNPIIFWLIFPVLGYVAYSMTGSYRKWFYMIIPAMILMLIQWNLTMTRPAEMKGIWDYTGIVAQAVLPQIILFAMLLFLFLLVANLFEVLLSKKEPEEEHLKKQHLSYFIGVFICLLAFSGLWLPWARSPRIMFFYHFLPPVTFFYPVLAYALFRYYKKSNMHAFFVVVYLILVVTSFVYFYPHVTGALVPEAQRELYNWLPSWK
jgi:dolichyl-phosphate-mannose--protein O-mannosyl transferase